MCAPTGRGKHSKPDPRTYCYQIKALDEFYIASKSRRCRKCSKNLARNVKRRGESFLSEEEVSIYLFRINNSITFGITGQALKTRLSNYQVPPEYTKKILWHSTSFDGRGWEKKMKEHFGVRSEWIPPYIDNVEEVISIAKSIAEEVKCLTGRQ